MLPAQSSLETAVLEKNYKYLKILSLDLRPLFQYSLEKANCSKILLIENGM